MKVREVFFARVYVGYTACVQTGNFPGVGQRLGIVQLFLNFCLIASFFSLPLVAMDAPGLSLAQVAGSSELVKQDMQEWAPFNGALALKSNWLRTLYLSEVQGDKSNGTATAHVLKDLFFMGDNDQLKVTTVKNRFGSQADARDVGCLAHLVYTNTIETVLAAKELTTFINAKKIKDLRDLSQRLKVGTPQPHLMNALELLAPTDMNDLRNKLAALEQKMGNHESKKRKAFTSFLGQLQGSLQECGVSGGRYYPYTPHAILMGFLVASAKDRTALADYFDTLSQLGTPVTIDAYDRERFLHEPLAQASLASTQELVRRVGERYAFPQSFDCFVDRNYEALSTLGILQNEFKIVSPFPDYAHITIPVEGIPVAFSDCVESSVRGFLNELLDSPSDGALHTEFFDTDVQAAKGSDGALCSNSADNIASSGLKAPAEIKQFYATFSDIHKHLTDEAHCSWASLFAQRKDLPLVYNTEKHAQQCEVAACYPFNTITMLAHALGIPAPEQPLTLASVCSFFSGISQQANQFYAANAIDKTITLQKVAVQKTCDNVPLEMQEVILDDYARSAQDFQVSELHEEVQMVALEGKPYCSSLALTFLVKTPGIEQQFSWHLEPKHSWLSVFPVAREQNLLRAQIMNSLPGFDQKLMQAVNETDVQTMTLAGLYYNHEELSALSRVLSPAGITHFCWFQHKQELKAILEKIKTERTCAHAETLAVAITKVALASEEEAFISPCMALLKEPAWSPIRVENEGFWKVIIGQTFPAKDWPYNKQVVHQVLCADSAGMQAGPVLSCLLEKVAETADEKVQALLLSQAQQENKTGLVQKELAKILQSRGASGSLSNAHF